MCSSNNSRVKQVPQRCVNLGLLRSRRWGILLNCLANFLSCTLSLPYRACKLRSYPGVLNKSYLYLLQALRYCVRSPATSLLLPLRFLVRVFLELLLLLRLFRLLELLNLLRLLLGHTSLLTRSRFSGIPRGF